MKIWKDFTTIYNKSYKNIDYYGSIEADFENSIFDTVLFYENSINCVIFKNCKFINCIFEGVIFTDSNLVQCTFKNCKFAKNNIGLSYTSENSLCVDCNIDRQSLKNIPLVIYQDKVEKLLTEEFVKELDEVFKISRPELAVDNPNHCLSCCETQETHENLPNLKQVKVEHFQICYISIEALSKDALLYYMPKLLELFLIGEDNDWEIFIFTFLSQLVPNKFGNRFKYYNKKQVKLIITVLEYAYNRYNKAELFWDYQLEMITDRNMSEDEFELCKKALSFWKEKYKKIKS